MRQARHAEAIELLGEAFSIIAANLGENSRELANVLSLKGECLLRLNKPDLAAADAFKGLKIRLEALDAMHPEVGWSIYDVGVACSYLGDNVNAEKFLSAAVAQLDRSLDSKHIGRVAVHGGVATFLASQGRQQMAMKHIDTAQQVAGEHARVAFPSMADAQRLIYAEKLGISLQRGLSLAFDNRTDQSIVDASARWLANGKEIAAETHAMQTRLRLLAGNTNPNATQLTSVREELAGLSMLGVKPIQDKIYAERIKYLTDEDSRLTRLLASEFGIEQAPPLVSDLEAIRKAIPKQSVLVDIALVTPSRFNSQTRSYERDPPRYLAWVVSPKNNAPVKLVDLGLAEMIDGLIVEVREQLKADSRKGAIVEGGGEILVTKRLTEKLQRLANFLYQPLTEYLKDAEELIISPDGSLWLVPWAAIPTGNGDEVLIEKYLLSFVNTSRSLLRRHENRTKAKGEFIFADPEYDASKDTMIGSRPTAVDSRSASKLSLNRPFEPVSRLYGADSEANEIFSQLSEIEAASPVIFLGENANELELKAVKSPRVLVLITHGFFLEGSQVEASKHTIALAPLDRQLAGEASASGIVNPFMSCGLLLAGCNSQASKEKKERYTVDNDGVLTGLEILGMDLRGTELVFLGACDTGTGKIRANEGVASLRQSFQIAGARTVIATLWPVDHIETQRISINFFEHLREGQRPEAALRTAQLNRIKQRREISGAAHPYFWAGLTATGK